MGFDVVSWACETKAKILWPWQTDPRLQQDNWFLVQGLWKLKGFWQEEEVDTVRHNGVVGDLQTASFLPFLEILYLFISIVE